jgi:protein required for attachment to host cells
MARLTKKTWVVVADGEKAMFLRNLTGPVEPQFELVSQTRKEHASEPKLRADRPGRRTDGGPNQKSAMEETDPRAMARLRFARDLSETLYSHARKNAFDKVVLVASPQVLGTLRADMHPEVAHRVVAEVPKTLTNHSLAKIQSVLTAELNRM